MLVEINMAPDIIDQLTNAYYATHSRASIGMAPVSVALMQSDPRAARRILFDNYPPATAELAWSAVKARIATSAAGQAVTGLVREPSWATRAEIGYELGVWPGSLTDADYDRWCASNPGDGYCQERFTLQGRAVTPPNAPGTQAPPPPSTPRDAIAHSLGVPPAQLTDQQVAAYCASYSGSAFDPMQYYCTSLLHPDDADIARIRSSLNIGDGQLTPAMLSRWCASNPNDPYCVRHGLAAARPAAPTLGTAGAGAPGMSTTGKLIVGVTAAAAIGALAYWLLKKD